ncbi:MAG: hypothetical protein JWN46_88 [Acidimicrobiales bacterium]|nr:hypothetical protein [Acidimicrobiales bacterium]
MAAHTDVVEATIEESTRGRRYPFQAIEALLPPTTSDLTYACGRLNPREAGALLGVCRRTILRWRARGVDEWTADRLACALNLHPAVVWPDWLDEQPIRVKKVNAGTPVSRNEPARVKNEAA